mmetsp:Transcript_24396/g.40088  ORF Transcript_24396/g.40088 Transcript_24396/m.40088 type:complete len:391 (-) Transcript_24396:302-1474(-)|eukprot:CAMPEP_0184656460 /NCGR_PEP_ID=MMETSP0308-20130426/16525_1 /TAXON_ID=38269 /ORGANISM="Gloeochaete witrockiana, Strain SAG 46.84" /LENGTH=390 /DNA_ID=CAMNT_0027093607 /DNA_START=45 /DNA_END=1217 /DNA_ORIENTATION=-
MLSTTERDGILDSLLSRDGLLLRPLARNEAEPSLQEKKNQLETLLTNKPAIFLERYGRLLPPEQLNVFNSDEYEIRYWINYYSSSPSKRNVVAKNRRYRRLQQLLSDGEYFSDEAMKERQPLLFEQFIGRYESKEATPFPADMPLSQRLLHDLDESELRRRIAQEQRVQRVELNESRRGADQDMIGSLTEEENEVEEEEEEEEEESDMIIGAEIRRDGESETASLSTTQPTSVDGAKQEESSDSRTGGLQNRDTANSMGVQQRAESPVARGQWGEFSGSQDRRQQMQRILIESQARHQSRLLQQQQEDDVETQVGDEGSGTEVPILTQEEKNEERRVFMEIMKERFISGEDKDYVDYTEIDENEMMDDLEQQQRDAEDSYFDEDDGYNGP